MTAQPGEMLSLRAGDVPAPCCHRRVAGDVSFSRWPRFVSMEKPGHLESPPARARGLPGRHDVVPCSVRQTDRRGRRERVKAARFPGALGTLILAWFRGKRGVGGQGCHVLLSRDNLAALGQGRPFNASGQALAADPCERSGFASPHRGRHCGACVQAKGHKGAARRPVRNLVRGWGWVDTVAAAGSTPTG